MLETFCHVLLPRNVTWTNEQRAISTSTGINGIRLAHHISIASTVTCLFIVFFETVLGRNIHRKFQKKFIGNF